MRRWLVLIVVLAGREAAADADGDTLVVEPTGPAILRPTLGFRFLRGPKEEEISAEDFYRTVGRPDLADSYRARQTTRIVMIAGGLSVQVTGVILYYASKCPDDCSTGTEIAAWSTVIGGAIIGVVGSYLQAHPMGWRELNALARKYNLSLTGGPGVGLGLQGKF